MLILDNFEEKIDRFINNASDTTPFMWGNESFTDEQFMIICDAIQNKEKKIQLIFKNCHLSSQQIYYLCEAIQHSQNLTILALDGNELNNETISQLLGTIQECSALKMLSLVSNHINDHFTHPICQLIESHKELLALNLSYNRMTSKGASAIFSSIKKSQISYLDFSKNYIFDEAAPSISSCLSNSNQLVELYLHGNKLSAKGAALLANGLRSNAKLHSLGLFGNQISDLGAYKLLDILKENQTLLHLNLGMNRLTETAFSNLDPTINLNLKSITLNDNLINHAGLDRILTIFGESLVNLNLSQTNLNNDSSKKLGLYLRKNKSLTSLNLSSNAFSDEGISNIARGLQNNQTLKYLDISNNLGSGYSIKKVFDSFFRKNSEQNWLDVSFNQIDEASTGYIYSGLKSQLDTNLYLEQIKGDFHSTNNWNKDQFIASRHPDIYTFSKGYVTPELYEIIKEAQRIEAKVNRLDNYHQYFDKIELGFKNVHFLENGSNIWRGKLLNYKTCQHLLEELINHAADGNYPWEKSIEDGLHVEKLRFKYNNFYLYPAIVDLFQLVLRPIIVDLWDIKPQHLLHAFLRRETALKNENSLLRWHHDSYSDLTVMIALNESFEGGGLQFYEQDGLTQYPALGEAILFPSKITHKRKYVPINNGECYLLCLGINIHPKYGYDRSHFR